MNDRLREALGRMVATMTEDEERHIVPSVPVDTEWAAEARRIHPLCPGPGGLCDLSYHYEDARQNLARAALTASDPAPAPPDKPAYMVGSAWPGGPAPAPVAPEGPPYGQVVTDNLGAFRHPDAAPVAPEGRYEVRRVPDSDMWVVVNAADERVLVDDEERARHVADALNAAPVAQDSPDPLAILDVIDGIVGDTHPEGDGCPLCIALDDLRAAIEGVSR